MEPMEHDGSPTGNHSSNRPSVSAEDNGAIRVASGRIPDPLSLETQGQTPTDRATLEIPGSGTPRRIFCPVVGCSEALTSSRKIFRDFKGIKHHLDQHCTIQNAGVIPEDFLEQHGYTPCNICANLVHK